MIGVLLSPKYEQFFMDEKTPHTILCFPAILFYTLYILLLLFERPAHFFFCKLLDFNEIPAPLRYRAAFATWTSKILRIRRDEVEVNSHCWAIKIFKALEKCVVSVLIFTIQTGWDLGACLPRECRWRSLAIPSCMQAWVDIKILFRHHYGFGKEVDR